MADKRTSSRAVSSDPPVTISAEGPSVVVQQVETALPGATRARALPAAPAPPRFECYALGPGQPTPHPVACPQSPTRQHQLVRQPDVLRPDGRHASFECLCCPGRFIHPHAYAPTQGQTTPAARVWTTPNRAQRRQRP